MKELFEFFLCGFEFFPSGIKFFFEAEIRARSNFFRAGTLLEFIHERTQCAKFSPKDHARPLQPPGLIADTISILLEGTKWCPISSISCFRLDKTRRCQMYRIFNGGRRQEHLVRPPLHCFSTGTLNLTGGREMQLVPLSCNLLRNDAFFCHLSFYCSHRLSAKAPAA